jgi:hypothetical protein
MPQLRLLFFALLVPLVLGGLPGCGDDDGPTDPPDGQVPDDAGDDEGMCPRDPSECGNGVVEPGESCEPPGTDTCDADCQRIPEEAPDPACDLTGHWAVEKVTVSAATVGTLLQEATTKNRMYYHIVQDGEQFEIVGSLECGFFVESLVTVTLSGDTQEALMCMVDSNGRQGTAQLNGDDCEVRFDTRYTVRGLSPMEHWLDDDWAPAEGMVASSPNLPAPDMPNCTCDGNACECDDNGRYDPGTGTPGWDDWDQNGLPGITILPGRDNRWYVHMRDWDRYLGTVPAGSAEAPLDDLELEVEWWNAQGLMAYTEGSIVADEQPHLEADHYVTLRRIDAPDRNALDDDALCEIVRDMF